MFSCEYFKVQSDILIYVRFGLLGDQRRRRRRRRRGQGHNELTHG